MKKMFLFSGLCLINMYAIAQLSICNCWIERDSTFSVVMFKGSGANGGPGTPPEYRNDDWSTNLINLPFSFCFYGANYNGIFINNNGNISFGAAYSTFTANPFPTADFQMVAPFWADVDTRGLGSGIVYMKIAPTHIIVQWDSVGYYNEWYDKTNSFQLIISNGSDSLIPAGNNVSFCYKDMQWTTGDASGGSNGFSGTAATVGVNKGDGVNYIQFGRFDKPGNGYDGPDGNPDAIDWLDNKSIIFSTCTASNFKPIVIGSSACPEDTLRICEGDTLSLSAIFHSPEIYQVTVVSAISTAPEGFFIQDSDTGNTAYITAIFFGTENNLGLNSVTFTATDNGLPVKFTAINYVIVVDSSSLTISEAGPFCEDDSAVFLYSNVTGGTWSGNGVLDSLSGEFDPSIAGVGTHSISYIHSSDLCPAITNITINPLPIPPQITYNGSVLVSGSSYGNQWYFNGTIIPGATGQQYDAIQQGNYSVLFTDSNGCSVESNPFYFLPGYISETSVNSLTVYPNPNDGGFTLFSNEKDYIFYIFDLTGNKIFEKKITDYGKRIILPGFSPGIYFYQINSEEGIRNGKLQIEK